MKKSTLLFIGLMVVASNKGFPQQTISDEGNRYSINIPPGWVYASSKNPIVSVLMSCDTLHPRERLTITYCRGIGSLQKVYNDNKKSMTELKKFRLMEEGEGMLDGEDCKWFVFTAEIIEGVVWKGRQYTIKPNKVFLIQYFVPEDRFVTVKDTFEQIISTFKLK